MEYLCQWLKSKERSDVDSQGVPTHVWSMSLTTASLCRTANNLTEASWTTHTLWSLFLQNQGLKPGHPSDNFCCCYSRISYPLPVLYSLGQGVHQHAYQHHKSSKQSQKVGIILNILWLKRKLRLSLVRRPTKIKLIELWGWTARAESLTLLTPHESHPKKVPKHSYPY